MGWWFFKKRRKLYGYVYFIENDNMIKIGCTINPERRFTEFRTTMPFMKILKIVKTRDHFRTEHYYHEKFAKYRITHEWYDKKIRRMI